jgi:hypothetical protein
MGKPNKVESKDDRYNKGREAAFRVEITAADSPETAEKIRRMKVELNGISGSAKQGIVDLYDFANKRGYFDDWRSQADKKVTPEK